MQQPYYYNPYDNQQSPLNTQSNQNSPEIEYFMHNLKIQKQKSEILKLGLLLGAGVMGYVIVATIASTVLLLTDNYDRYLNDPSFQSCFNILASSFMGIAVPFGIIALFMRKKYTVPIVPMEKVGKGKSFLWICFGMLACMLANIVTNYVIEISELLGYKLNYPEMAPIDSAFGCVLSLIGLAIMPAVCEEFAMRCCALGLLRKHGKAFGIIAISIVFGLLHGNVIQFVFAFLVGVILAYITIKTNSVLPAIIIHACNNGLSVVQDVATYLIDEGSGETIANAFIVFWMISGAIAFVILLVKKELFIKEEQKSEEDVLPLGKKLLYLLPGLALPLLYLLVTTISTIEKL